MLIARSDRVSGINMKDPLERQNRARKAWDPTETLPRDPWPGLVPPCGWSARPTAAWGPAQPCLPEPTMPGAEAAEDGRKPSWLLLSPLEVHGQEQNLFKITYGTRSHF